jgi:hypothetical protein
MIKGWKSVLPLLAVPVVELVSAHVALALPSTAIPLPPLPLPKPLGAPELDPRLAIEGLAVAAGCAALWWERFRRHR